MELSPEEIIDYWDTAKDKNIALDRLAVVCRTDRAGMRARLLELGVEPEELEAIPQKKMTAKAEGRHYSHLDKARVREMYDEGKNDYEIAKALGCSTNAIFNWRKKNGLPANAAAPRKGKARELTTGLSEPCEPCVTPKRESCDGCGNRDSVTVRPQLRIAMEPREEKPFTLGALKSYLTSFLPAALNGAALYIDGKPVTEIYGFSITQPDGVATVDILTRRTT